MRSACHKKRRHTSGCDACPLVPEMTKRTQDIGMHTVPNTNIGTIHAGLAFGRTECASTLVLETPTSTGGWKSKAILRWKVLY